VFLTSRLLATSRCADPSTGRHNLTAADDVFAVWQQLLRRPDRSVSLDSARL
jgi:hypothetical protein